ncbi:hydrolase 1, exosortase A system-associated [Aquisediminimonas sediminicola]|uniref:hydrolase 1, exosortase A system-associated n=1 Tax=Alteraquisediminimonas sediminicola TaxID=2676787 RepID=UPI001C8D665C|nr:hydrolase 1, exosortase A system-associated [Aquisediminimonas sediminicola]
MRALLHFTCEDASLAATLDQADNADTALLIVSGGTEIRSGAHQGMAQLASHLRRHQINVLRFDRRGVGDSGGVDPGFENVAPDIAAAIAALRHACPQVRHIYAYGNCDAAAALVLHHHNLGLSGLLLSNPWTIDEAAGQPLPPSSAIRARYINQLTHLTGWKKLITGSVDYRKLLIGIRKIFTSSPPLVPDALGARLGQCLAQSDLPVHILLARYDNTAIAFADAWTGPHFTAARRRANIHIDQYNTASHSFAGEADAAALRDFCLRVLRGD